MVPIAYNNITSRTDVEALIPEEVSRTMLGKENHGSAVLDLFRRIPVSRNQVRFPVLSALPTAYWVTGDTGLKQTTEMAWANKLMNIEELAVILPVPENVVADIEIDIWDAAMPLITDAFHRALDAAVFFGSNAPASFPTNIQASVIAAGNTATEGTAATGGGYYADLDKLLDLVELDGFDVSGFVANRSVRGKLRAARNADGVRLDAGRVNGDLGSIDGAPIAYPMRGMWAGTTGAARIFAGDFASQFVVGVREDITVKILDQAVIQDSTGAIVFNLAQQDAVGLRVKARFGWQVSNTINDDNPNVATRYPSAALLIP